MLEESDRVFATFLRFAEPPQKMQPRMRLDSPSGKARLQATAWVLFLKEWLDKQYQVIVEEEVPLVWHVCSLLYLTKRERRYFASKRPGPRPWSESPLS